MLAFQRSKSEKVLMRHSWFGQQLLGHFQQNLGILRTPDYEYAEVETD